MKPNQPHTRALEKYLSGYAESESTGLKTYTQCHQQGLVIPFYKESPASLERFCDFAQRNPSTLLILVINRPNTDNDSQWIKQLFNHPFLSKTPTWLDEKYALAYRPLENNSGLLTIDRGWQGPPINSEQGVGLARKIGADILTRLIYQQQVKSPWIACTDADAILPDDYFKQLQTVHTQASSKNIAACIFPFSHSFIDDTPTLPTLLYEYWLHYYVNGLRWAGSPYAYHTIGSIICPHYLYYSKVRGFPKRAAAEDFYLLNKLAKTGTIVTLEQATIELIARESTRVPFGTGPAVIKLAEQNTPLAMPLYHPLCFKYLRFFLQLINHIAKVDSHTGEINISDQATLLKQTNNSRIDIKPILNLAIHFKLSTAITHSFKHGKTAATRQRQLQHWFDGFKTLKCIHWLRDNFLASIEYQQWQSQQDSHCLKDSTAMRKITAKIQTCQQTKSS